MGDWTGTVPTFTAGAKLRGVDMATLAAIDTALVTGWTTWVPTIANLTVGSGTLTAKYRRVGKTVDIFFRFVYGAGSAVGTQPAFSPPATLSADIAATYDISSRVLLLDAGTAVRPGYLARLSSTSMGIFAWSTANAETTITSTAPWTWATGDTISCWGTFYTD